MNRKRFELIALYDHRSANTPPALPDDCKALAISPNHSVIVGPRPKAPPNLRKQSARAAAFAQATLLRQQRLEALCDGIDPLPFSPGTAVPADLTALADANAETIALGLQRIAGRRQFQIVVTWDEDAASHRFKGTSTGLEDARAQLRDFIVGELAEVADDAIALPCESDGVANVVTLISTNQMSQLDAVVDRIDAVWTEGLRIRVLGPAPAVSFARGLVHNIGLPERNEAAAILSRPTIVAPRTEEVETARKRVLRTAASEQGYEPALIEKSAQIMRLCASLDRPPCQKGDIPFLTLERDAPSVAKPARVRMGKVA